LVKTGLRCVGGDSHHLAIDRAGNGDIPDPCDVVMVAPPVCPYRVTNTVSGDSTTLSLNSTSVTIGENSTGTFTYSYVVADRLGATATGQLTATVTGLSSRCPQF
jgi:hypothetical protein